MNIYEKIASGQFVDAAQVHAALNAAQIESEIITAQWIAPEYAVDTLQLQALKGTDLYLGIGTVSDCPECPTERGLYVRDEHTGFEFRRVYGL